MPRIKGIAGPYRVFFTSFDCNEPPHVHVERESGTCKFWLEPVSLARNHEFTARELNVIRRIMCTASSFWRLGMSTVVSSEPRIRSVRVTKDEIIAHLVDGRVISVPLAWSWRLSEATAAQRSRFRIIGSGQGVHWPDVDEDISVEGMLHGVPAPRPKDRDLTVPSEAKRHGPANKSMQPARVRGRANSDRRHARG